MDSKLRKYRTKYFITGVIGFGIGATLWEIFMYEDNFKRIISGIIFSTIVKIVLDAYYHKKHPDLKEKIEISDKDERLIAIRGKVAYVVNCLMVIIMGIGWLVAEYNENDEISIVLVALILTTLTSTLIGNYILGKKM